MILLLSAKGEKQIHILFNSTRYVHIPEFQANKRGLIPFRLPTHTTKENTKIRLKLKTEAESLVLFSIWLHFLVADINLAGENVTSSPTQASY